jgi:malate/lactate dehydrogenase
MLLASSKQNNFDEAYKFIGKNHIYQRVANNPSEIIMNKAASGMATHFAASVKTVHIKSGSKVTGCMVPRGDYYAHFTYSNARASIH